MGCSYTVRALPSPSRPITLSERVKDFYVLNGEDFEAIIDVDKTCSNNTLLFNVSYTLDVPGIGQISHQQNWSLGGQTNIFILNMYKKYRLKLIKPWIHDFTFDAICANVARRPK